MATKLVWQQDSNNPDNVNNFALISQWWTTLNAQEIFWQQRLIPESGETEAIDWEPQRFDDRFTIQMPEVRGITLYWYKPGSEGTRNITANKLELDTVRQQLSIYPLSQSQVVIRVSKPQIVYQTFELQDPLIAGTTMGDNCVLLLRDSKQQIEIKLTLSRNGLGKLLENLPG